MSEAERMMLEDAIEQAIDTERENSKLKKWLAFLALACLFLFAWAFKR